MNKFLCEVLGHRVPWSQMVGEGSGRSRKVDTGKTGHKLEFEASTRTFLGHKDGSELEWAWEGAGAHVPW